ncbi:MAG: TrbC/VirB2 family protein [Candidatus Dojkabacteria bacterium]|nr:TrbC/VirB2 family protein [Candidatus Dojkabacteria bacterium]
MFVDLDFLNNTGFDNLYDFLTSSIDLIISLSVVIVVIAIIISGFKFILSMGDEKKIKEASSSLIFALIGLVLVFTSPTIIQFIIKEILLGAN